MLLVHQEGSVKVGEVVRYTLTYTPSRDRILPSPSQLYIRIKNTSAIPYRAAYLVGPYTLHVSAYPSTFNPYKKLENPKRDGLPQFEPHLKAGGHWHARITVPEEIQERGDRAQRDEKDDGSPNSVTWIIEVSSQILFSNSATVQYELLVARDERSLDTGFAALASRGHGEPGKLNDLVQFQIEGPGRYPAPRGVYSKAVDLTVEGTSQLWHKPALPSWEDQKLPSASKTEPPGATANDAARDEKEDTEDEPARDRRKKIHLVLLTHGLHSNVGADMLYMKESIDATARQAREEGKARRAKLRARDKKSHGERFKEQPSAEKATEDTATAPLSGGQEEISDDDDDPDDEQVIVRGFSGNAVRTEKGIQYLGKRLAKYILTVTYPDQPFLPAAKSMNRTLSGAFSSLTPRQGQAAHNGSSVHKAFNPDETLPYTFTSISFIGHSLGGLVQLYAIGYIQKHSPDFFKKIQPKNFITMAAPLLGLSNENPLYVKFALDFGLVGRTGKDLGLTWRAPTIARSGWSAVISGFASGQKEEEAKPEDPRAKPLLRILPSGPAHQVLKMFRNRTVYSNAVNDGIVPLRTSCLLFLDWRGLGRVENARRSNGLIGSMAQFGWAELTGANTISHRPKSSKSAMTDEMQSSEDEEAFKDLSTPELDLKSHSRRPSRAADDLVTPAEPSPNQFLGEPPHIGTSFIGAIDSSVDQNSLRQPGIPTNPFNDFLNFFRPKTPKPEQPTRPRGLSRKSARAIHRAQIVAQGIEDPDQSSAASGDDSATQSQLPSRPIASRGSSTRSTNISSGAPPPKTSIFEAAGDILNPPIPTQQWLIDPSSRNRTIFHDRIYHPEDIPPPPQKRSRSGLSRSFSSSDSVPSIAPGNPNSTGERTRTEKELGPDVDASGMKVEEKIARAYHRDLSWRKVLVRLEPDAHNNMIVRRMFANAYGWDVVRHLCDTHFSNSYAATTQDHEEDSKDRAKAPDEPVEEGGEKVHGQDETQNPEASETNATVEEGYEDKGRDVPTEAQATKHSRTISEMREATDEIADLPHPPPGGSGSKSSNRRGPHRDSMAWSDSVFEGTDDEWDE